ncbi:SRPBCC family protein [Metaplanococcus flavidus]
MRAEITQQDEGYKAVFERTLDHNTDSVWNMLTDNSRLAQWFDELRIGEAEKMGN